MVPCSCSLGETIVSVIIMFLQAIENGHFSELKAAVQSMKQETCPGVPREHCLDICFMIPYSNDLYPMTLLAFAGYHTSKEMLDLLIHEGASKYS